jgi:prevent-host-death family protein
MQWQVQDAKQRFSEVLRRAHDDGPQIVTRHGTEVAVVIDIREYRRLQGKEVSFKDFLMTPVIDAAADGEFTDLLDAITDARQDDRGRDLTDLFGED